MRALQVAFDAFWAEHAAVKRELLPRLEANDLIPPDLELDAALLSTEAAVRFDEPLHLRAVRLGIEGIDAARSEVFEKSQGGSGWRGHNHSFSQVTTNCWRAGLRSRPES